MTRIPHHLAYLAVLTLYLTQRLNCARNRGKAQQSQTASENTSLSEMLEASSRSKATPQDDLIQYDFTRESSERDPYDQELEQEEDLDSLDDDLLIVSDGLNRSVLVHKGDTRSVCTRN